MKTFSMRVDNPVRRYKFESTGSVTLKTLILQGLNEELYISSSQTAAVVAGEYMVRLKSVVFRAKNQFGEKSVEVFGRKYFAIFKSNNMTASVDFEGTPLNLWFPVTFAAEATSVTSDYLDAATGLVSQDIVAPEGVTATLVFEAYAIAK